MAAMLARSSSSEVPIVRGQHSPPSPSLSWEETMNDLSRQLQRICRSPTNKSMGSMELIPSKQVKEKYGATVIPSFTLSPPSSQASSPVNFRHSHSDELFLQRLNQICLTPRPKRATSEGDKTEKLRTPQRQLFHGGARRHFEEIVDIKDAPLEELDVVINGTKVTVNTASRCIRSMDLPENLDPSTLMCVVADGRLSISCTTSPGSAHRAQNPHGSMAVIDYTSPERLRVFLPYPDKISADKIKILASDDTITMEGFTNKDGNQDGLFKRVFQLPQPVEPSTVSVSIKSQTRLIIEATLSLRPRCLSV